MASKVTFKRREAVQSRVNNFLTTDQITIIYDREKIFACYCVFLGSGSKSPDKLPKKSQTDKLSQNSKTDSKKTKTLSNPSRLKVSPPLSSQKPSPKNQSPNDQDDIESSSHLSTSKNKLPNVENSCNESSTENLMENTISKNLFIIQFKEYLLFILTNLTNKLCLIFLSG